MGFMFRRATFFFLFAIGIVVVSRFESVAAELHVGASTISITPEKSVALAGQMHTRISKKVESEAIASVLALESREGDEVLEQAIMVSCDLVAIRDGVLEAIRERVSKRLKDFDVSKLIASATHTHTAPAMMNRDYDLSDGDVMHPDEYFGFLADRVAEAVVKAWQARKPGSVGWGMGHAVVAQNRRSVYADGEAVMYGSTGKAEFRRIEGYEDHGVEVLFFWNKKKELVATAVNVACPAQEVEGRSSVNADYWHPIRKTLQAKYGEKLVVLGWIGAAGDQSPHLMFRKKAEERMRKLRGLTRLEEISRRVVRAWEEAYEGAKQEPHSDIPFVHHVETIELPIREVTDAELKEAKVQVAALSKNPKMSTKLIWHKKAIDRYQLQQQGLAKPYEMELHTIRLGDIAIATNDFELFTDFGIQMKARSKALQTFVIQLAGPGSYIPTEIATAGGGYSAVIQSNKVGWEGGQVLAEQTIERLNSLWPAEK